MDQKFKMDEVQEEIDFKPQHKILQNFFVSVNKEIVKDIEKTSKVHCFPMDEESANMIDFYIHHIDEYKKPNASQFIKDAINYFVAENYPESYSEYMNWKGEQ